MARVRERLFAGFGAFLFLASACALTIFVILQPGSDTTASQASQQTCDINTPVPEPSETAPAIYKPDGAVTQLDTTDIKTGSGATAKTGDCLVMKYQGNLATDGSVFDEDYSKPQALQFTLGQGQVIPGWDQGLAGMKVGGTRRVVIPAALGYGDQSPSTAIPANSDLVFVVKLIEIKKV